jgi:hypothetical protein
MAGVSVPFLDPNYGGQIAGIENTGANTSLANAQTGVVSEQAKQEAMNTQIQRATMPMIMQAMSEATADQSGANPGNHEAGGGAAPGGVPGPASQRAAADQSGARPLYSQDSLEDTLRNNNYVQPYTQQELQMLKIGTALSLNPKTAAAGTAMVERMKVSQQARTQNQTAQNQNKMGNVYDAATAVATKGPGSFKALLATDPQDAAAINPAAARGDIEPTADDDLKATQYAKHLAAVSSLYTGRPLKMENGQIYDERTGQAIQGRDQLFTGLGPKELQAEYDKAREQIPWTTPDGVEHKDERWRAPEKYGGYGGKLTPAQAALAADQAARHNVTAPDGSVHPPGVVPQDAAAGTGATSPPIHGAAAGRRVNQKNAAVPPKTGADIAAGTAAATGADTGTLPGVNPAQLTKTISPAAGAGPGGPSIASKGLQEGVAARQNEEIKATRTASVDAQTMRSQIIQARAAAAKVDPRNVGPGSTIYNGILKTITALAGKAPDDLVQEGVLDKFLNQMGASNVRQLLAGQRITNQEMMTFLTRGSPSTAMPLGGINHLIDYLDADNEYTLRYNRTKMMALKSGADPDLVDQELSSRVNRADFVSRKTQSGDALSKNGAAPAKAPAAQADITEEAHGKLNHGDAFYWQGKLHHKGVD